MHFYYNIGRITPNWKLKLICVIEIKSFPYPLNQNFQFYYIFQYFTIQGKTQKSFLNFRNK